MISFIPLPTKKRLPAPRTRRTGLCSSGTWYRIWISILVTLIIFQQLDPTALAQAEANQVKLLKKIQYDSFRYFTTYTNQETGLTYDSSQPGSPASIAATGFALASFAVATQHGWLSYKNAYRRILKTINTLEKKAQQKNGFYYHFLDAETGRRVWNSEVSSMDTALLLAGALVAATYFKGTELEKRVNKLYERIEWEWMLNNTLLFNHGWKPGSGFLPYYWDRYAEHLILLALALGSKTHPAPKETWTQWERLSDTYHGKEIIYAYTGSLFTYQFSHAFIDFRRLNDSGVDYFENSKKAALANIEFSQDQAKQFESYRQGFWGLSASLGPDGYRAYGAMPGLALNDGTIAPYAVIASITLLPQESIRAIESMYVEEGQKIYGPYGFRDAFNLDQHWRANQYLGIDQGITVLMLENYLNHEGIWKRFMRLPMIQKWLERSGISAH